MIFQGLHILQWNCNSILNKQVEFKKFLNSFNSLPDVICLQETRLGNKYFKCESYNVLSVPTDRGVCFLIRKDLSFSKFTHLKFNNVEGISVVIHSMSGPIEIVNLYCSPSKPLDEEDLKFLFNKDNVFICGDFNSKSTLWGSSFSDTRGRFLESLLDNSDLVCLNSGSPTRFSNYGFSHLDLAFCSSKWAGSCHWESLSFDAGSDHSCISINFNCNITYEK